MTTTTTPATTRDFTIGTTIGPWVRDTGLANWNRFAAVNDEFVSIHMDEEAGRAAGMPGAIGPGNLLVAYLHALVRDWMGADGTLVSIAVQFRKPNTKGRITAGGTITSVTTGDEGTRVELDVWLKDENDHVLVPGSAVVRFAS
ncbi:MaoC family dehydratase [Rhodococcus koreensis]